MSNNVFVFVLCGAKEHIDTLHFSLERLQRFTKNRILVLTDGKRNELPIKHDDVIDIETPKAYTNHQASIYLKTGIHKFLPKGNNYCYLDTDVVALSKEVDEIFNEYKAPISFAPDHCKVKKFSAYAVNCGCYERWEIDWNRFKTVSKKYDKNQSINDQEIKRKAQLLHREFEKLKSNLFKKYWTALRYFLSFKKFNFNEAFYFDKQTQEWKDSKTDRIIIYPMEVDKIEQETGMKYHRIRQIWMNKHGKNIWEDECTHLIDQIKATFGIEVKESNWQHWNGGVFLFNDSSHSFLDSWHSKTIEAFSLPEWKTRDQGTLIATAWEFDLANHSTLDKRWNFIADHNNAGLVFNEQGQFSDDYWESSYEPAFIHIYHHWGDKTWDIWNWVVNKNLVK